MAKETYYFSHDSNAITDTKILNMRADYGLEGYGLYWAIIEMMRNEEDYSLQIGKNTCRAIKTLTNTNIDIEKYIDDCIEDYKLFTKNNDKFTSNSLLRRMTQYEKKKTINRENGKLGGRPKKQNKTEEKANGFQDETKNNQNKVKESKGKESKENESANADNTVSDSCVDGLQKIINFYNNNIGLITPYGIEVLKDFTTEMSEDLIILAMKKAVEANKRTIQYIKGILNNWSKKGIKTILEAEQEDIKFRKIEETIKETKEESEEERIQRETKELEEAMKKCR